MISKLKVSLKEEVNVPTLNAASHLLVVVCVPHGGTAISPATPLWIRKLLYSNPAALPLIGYQAGYRFPCQGPHSYLSSVPYQGQVPAECGSPCSLCYATSWELVVIYVSGPDIPLTRILQCLLNICERLYSLESTAWVAGLRTLLDVSLVPSCGHCALTWELVAAGASCFHYKPSTLLLLPVKLICAFLLEVTDCHPSTPLPSPTVTRAYLPLLLVPLHSCLSGAHKWLASSGFFLNSLSSSQQNHQPAVDSVCC